MIDTKEKNILDNTTIIAGNGKLPIIVAKKLMEKKNSFNILCFDDKNYYYFLKIKTLSNKVEKISLSNLEDIKNKIKKNKTKNVICCGGVKFCGLKIKINFLTIKYILKTIIHHKKGDNFLLNLAENVLKDIGCKIIPVQNIVPDILCSKKDTLNIKLAKQYKKDIDYGFEVLKEISKFDIGQAIVIQNGRVLGIEGQEGTAELIERCAEYAKRDKKHKPVLVKTSKVGQNMKLDVPSIGEETIKSLIKNNYAGIAIEDNSVFIIDKKGVFTKITKENNKNKNNFFLFVK